MPINTSPQALEINIESLIEDLGSGYLTVRNMAIKNLLAVGAPALPALAKAIQMNDAAIRDNAIRTLSQMGEPAVPIFASVLDDRREPLRGAAIDALGGMDVSVKMAVPSLIIVLLSDKNVEIREKSANLLGEIGTDAKETIPALTYALGDDSKNVRIKAVEALGE